MFLEPPLPPGFKFAVPALPDRHRTRSLSLEHQRTSSSNRSDEASHYFDQPQQQKTTPQRHVQIPSSSEDFTQYEFSRLSNSTPSSTQQTFHHPLNRSRSTTPETFRQPPRCTNGGVYTVDLCSMLSKGNQRIRRDGGTRARGAGELEQEMRLEMECDEIEGDPDDLEEKNWRPLEKSTGARSSTSTYSTGLDQDAQYKSAKDGEQNWTSGYADPIEPVHNSSFFPHTSSLGLHMPTAHRAVEVSNDPVERPGKERGAVDDARRGSGEHGEEQRYTHASGRRSEKAQPLDAPYHPMNVGKGSNRQPLSGTSEHLALAHDTDRPPSRPPPPRIRAQSLPHSSFVRVDDLRLNDNSVRYGSRGKDEERKPEYGDQRTRQDTRASRAETTIETVRSHDGGSGENKDGKRGRPSRKSKSKEDEQLGSKQTRRLTRQGEFGSRSDIRSASPDTGEGMEDAATSIHRINRERAGSAEPQAEGFENTVPGNKAAPGLISTHLPAPISRDQLPLSCPKISSVSGSGQPEAETPEQELRSRIKRKLVPYIRKELCWDAERMQDWMDWNEDKGLRTLKSFETIDLTTFPETYGPANADPLPSLLESHRKSLEMFCGGAKPMRDSVAVQTSKDSKVGQKYVTSIAGEEKTNDAVDGRLDWAIRPVLLSEQWTMSKSVFEVIKTVVKEGKQEDQRLKLAGRDEKWWQSEEYFWAGPKSWTDPSTHHVEVPLLTMKTLRETPRIAISDRERQAQHDARSQLVGLDAHPSSMASLGSKLRSWLSKEGGVELFDEQALMTEPPPTTPRRIEDVCDLKLVLTPLDISAFRPNLKDAMHSRSTSASELAARTLGGPEWQTWETTIQEALSWHPAAMDLPVPLFPLRTGAAKMMASNLAVSRTPDIGPRSAADQPEAKKRKTIPTHDTLKDAGHFIQSALPRKQGGWALEPSSEVGTEDSSGLTLLDQLGDVPLLALSDSSLPPSSPPESWSTPTKVAISPGRSQWQELEALRMEPQIVQGLSGMATVLRDANMSPITPIVFTSDDDSVDMPFLPGRAGSPTDNESVLVNLPGKKKTLADVMRQAMESTGLGSPSFHPKMSIEAEILKDELRLEGKDSQLRLTVPELPAVINTVDAASYRARLPTSVKQLVDPSMRTAAGPGQILSAGLLQKITGLQQMIAELSWEIAPVSPDSSIEASYDTGLLNEMPEISGDTDLLLQSSRDALQTTPPELDDISELALDTSIWEADEPMVLTARKLCPPLSSKERGENLMEKQQNGLQEADVNTNEATSSKKSKADSPVETGDRKAEHANKRRRTRKTSPDQAVRNGSYHSDEGEMLPAGLQYLKDSMTPATQMTSSVTSATQAAKYSVQGAKAESMQKPATRSSPLGPVCNPDWVTAGLAQCAHDTKIVHALVSTEILQKRDIMRSLDYAGIQAIGKDDLETTLSFGNRCGVIVKYVSEVQSSGTQLARQLVRSVCLFPNVICVLIARSNDSPLAPDPWTTPTVQAIKQLPGMVQRNFAMAFPGSPHEGVEIVFAESPSQVGPLLRVCAERAADTCSSVQERDGYHQVLYNDDWVDEEANDDHTISSLREELGLSSFAATYILACTTVQHFYNLSSQGLIDNFGPMLGYDTCARVGELLDSRQMQMNQRGLERQGRRSQMVGRPPWQEQSFSGSDDFEALIGPSMEDDVQAGRIPPYTPGWFDQPDSEPDPLRIPGPHSG